MCIPTESLYIYCHIRDAMVHYSQICLLLSKKVLKSEKTSHHNWTLLPIGMNAESSKFCIVCGNSLASNPECLAQLSFGTSQPSLWIVFTF
jgi:hypothetical protein